MVNQKPNKPDHIFIDQKRHDWEAPAITGAQLKQAHLQSEWVILDCFSYGFEHTGQDFQAKILLIA